MKNVALSVFKIEIDFTIFRDVLKNILSNFSSVEARDGQINISLVANDSLSSPLFARMLASTGSIVGKWFCLLIVLVGFAFSVHAQTCQPPAAPSLTTTAGPGFKEVTHTFTGVQNSSGYYSIHGSHNGGAYGAPFSAYAVEGQAITFTTSAWGINNSLDTNQSYNFYLTTSSYCGATVQSNTTSATTFDIQAPALIAVAGPGFDEITFSVEGIPGSEGYYNIFGAPVGGTYGAPLTIQAAAGQTVTFTSGAWGINQPLKTNETYNFYVETWSGTRYRQSSVISVTTRDIQAPTLVAIQVIENHATLTWNVVEGAEYYTVYTFSTAQNQWNAITAGIQSSGVNHLSANIPVYDLNRTYDYFVAANRNTRRRDSNGVSVAFYKDQDAGADSCKSVGKPVNVTNGNMYLQQTDYNLPGIGENINLTRTYNSMIQSSGRFGFGWATAYDQYLTAADNYTLRLSTADGRAVYFGRTETTAPFNPVTPGFYGQIVKNADNTYTLSYKDGTEDNFSMSGSLLWQKDRNGNQTTLTYDGSGNLSGITDAVGRTLIITPNANGTVYQISDSLGIVATYEYFPGTTLLKTVTYNDGSKYKFEYTTVGGKTYLTTVKDALDNILEFHEYDSQGRATTSEVQGGVEKYTLDYTNANQATNSHTIVTDALGRVTKYYFDRSRGRIVVTKTEGNCNCGGAGAEVTSYEYDGKLNLTKKVDALGREKSYTYDSNGNPLTEQDKIGTVDLGTETYTYNSFGQVLTRTDKMSGVTTNTYDANGNLKTTTDALGNVTTVVYPAANNKGLPDSIKDARLNITKFKWFAASGLLEETEDPFGKKTKYTYDARGRTKTVTNALNHTTTYNYFDDTQRKVEMIYPNADKITYKYDIRRLLESVTDERGKLTNYEFDAAYRLKKITDTLSHAKEFDYDLMSNVKWTKDGLGKQTDYLYDEFDRLKEVIYPPSETGATRLKEKFEYDAVGRIKKQTDTANRETVYAYDDQTRTNTVTNPELEVTTTKYNARGQMIEVKDALNQIYAFTYNPFGQTLTQTRAGTTMSYEYDAVGNRKKRIDYLGRETTYEYDLLNRLKKINYLQTYNSVPVQTPIHTASYTYDDISQLKTATNEAGTVTFNYDNRNRIESTIDVFGHTINYEYELTPTVNQKRLKFDGAMYAKYNFDDANRLTNIFNQSDSTTITFGYDNADKLTSRVYPNGVTTTYDYDGMSRLKRLKDVSTTATLFDRQMTYTNASQINQITEPTNTRTFGYDLVDRLKTVTASNNQNESYNFDDVGNRTSSHRSASYGYQPFNKLTSTVTANYAYDANGNLVSKGEGSNFWRYAWDYENRLTTASTRKQTVRYLYDALGRRVQRHLKGGANQNTKFIYDGQDVLVDDNGGTLTKYLNGEGIDNKLRVQTGSDVKYFLTDHLGSTNGLADAWGNLTASTNYDSFGNATNTNFPTRYQFTGREFDSFTGLHYYRARFYDANLGRFISEDPIGFAGGDVNLYGYVKNKPLQFTDPSGNIIIPVPLVTAGIGAAAGFFGSIIGKGINNYRCGKGFFHGSDTSGYWTDVAIATGGGAVVGALMPFGGTSLAGAAYLGAGGNAAQYGASVALGRTQYSRSGLGLSIATGALGGAAGGAFNKVKPWSSGYLTNAADAASFRAANNEASILANTGAGTLSRNVLGGAVGNSPNPSDPCSCQ